MVELLNGKHRRREGRLVPVLHQIYRTWVGRQMALRLEPLHKFETVAAYLWPADHP